MTVIRRLAFLVLLVTATVGVVAAQGPPKQRVAIQKRSLNTKGTEQPLQNREAADKVMPPVSKEPSAHIPDTETAKSREDIEIQRKLVKLTKWLAIVGGLQFVALIVQAAVFYFTLRLLRDTGMRQLRAYILVSSALLKFPTPDVPEVQVHFKNFGQTPAYDVHGWIGMYIGDYPLTVVLPPAPYNLRMGKEPLAPGRASIHVVERDPPIPAEYLPLVGTPQGTVWVYGEIVYRDAFSKHRYCKYRLMCGGPGGVRPVKSAEGIITGYLLKADTEGNEAN